MTALRIVSNVFIMLYNWKCCYKYYRLTLKWIKSNSNQFYGARFNLNFFGGCLDKYILLYHPIPFVARCHVGVEEFLAHSFRLCSTDCDEFLFDICRPDYFVRTSQIITSSCRKVGAGFAYVCTQCTLRL